MKRPFYIIHHNPNRAGGAEEKGSTVYALTNGANALGPDILFIENKLRVMHDKMEDINEAPLLKDYLAGLSEALQNNSALNLQLIAFDLKETGESPFDFKEMQKIINDNFSRQFHNVGMIFSTPDNFDFLLKNVAPHLTSGQAIGTDEYDDPAYSHERFKEGGFNYIYGLGNSNIFNDVYEPVSKAVSMRDSGKSFKMVYPWTIDTREGYRRYLDLGVDGMITNEPERLKKLIEDEYPKKYRLDGTFAGF